MSSATMNETAREALDMPAAGGTSYYAEDGWVFREFPGKGIECVGRYEDLKGTLRLDGGVKAHRAIWLEVESRSDSTEP